MDVVSTSIFAAMPLIEQRLKMQAYFSEDNFRYLVFHGLFKSGMDVVRLALEYPHPGNSRESEKVDTVILDADGIPEIAIEFKYHRSNHPSGNDIDSTGYANALLADFAKLRDFSAVQCFVVYLTAEKMLRYFQNPENGLSWILDPWNEQEISKSKVHSTDTSRDEAGDWECSALSQMLGNWVVASDHRLIVWRVKPLID